MESFVRSLSSNPNRPCFFLQYGETFMLLDCGLDVSTTLRFPPVSQVFTPALAQIKPWNHQNAFLYSTENDILENEGTLLINGVPEFQIPDFQRVSAADLHYVLISNFAQIFALPFLVNEKNFHGTIYATEPTIQLAKDVFHDLSSYLGSYGSSVRAEKWKVKEVKQFLPPVLQQTKPQFWRPLCSMEAFESALRKVEVINFHQSLALENSLTITACSSGFCMGSCNWVIETPEEKLVYMSDSSALTTHLLPIDLAKLKNPDVIIVSALNMDPMRSPEDSLKMMGQAIKDAVRDGGNVLIPYSSVDLLIDMLEYLFIYMEDLPSNLPICVVAGSGHSQLSLAQVFSEWLNEEYRDRAYLPEEPFTHGRMIRENRLKVYPSVDGKFSEGFKSPCVVFCTHYSLRMGPAVHLLSQWKNSPKNAIVFTDPEFHPNEALAPYLPVTLKVAYCPVDTRLKPGQLTKIIEELAPKTVIIHERYLSPWDASSEASEHMVRCPKNTKVLPLKPDTDIILPVEFRWLKTVAPSELISAVPMISFKNVNKKHSDILVGRIFGGVISVDNQYTLSECTKGDGKNGGRFPVWTDKRPDSSKLLRLLKKEGLGEVVLEEDANGHKKLVCERLGFTIDLHLKSTEVTFSRPSKETRGKVRNVLLLFRQPESAPTSAVGKDDEGPSGHEDVSMELEEPFAAP